MIDQLYSNRNNLNAYLKNNTVNITSYFNSDYKVLESIKFKIDDVAIELENTLDQLDYSKYYNSLFILTLLDYSEKFRALSAYEVFYNIAKNNNLSIGDRQKASKTYLLDIILQEDHFSKIEDIINLLENAYLTEEDNENAVLYTFGNYILNAVLNTADVDLSIINRIIFYIKEVKSRYNFLSFELIDNIITIEPEKGNNYISKIKSLLEKNASKYVNQIGETSFIIESESKYSELVSTYNYSSIRQISINSFNNFSAAQKTKYHKELLRGVKIIDSEEQLFTYLTLFGKKHQRKLNIAFQYLSNLPESYNIIDWACGQGLASMLFLDKYGSNNVQKIILNEPSGLAIKRASLHLKGYNKNIAITTIKKTIDQLNINDISSKNNFDNIHLFSNILDMELDFIHLTNLIETSCSGLNYFICVSPYTPREISTNRIDFFVNYFKNKYGNNYTLIKSKNIQNGDPTMVLRMFSVKI